MKRAPSLPRHTAATVARLSIALALVLSIVLALGVGPAAAAPKDQLQESGDPPVFAYYYIWFNPTSWDRAKTDYPLLGHYSSDERQIMRQHIRWAKQAGISGFLVSWKSTSDLNRRLSKLLTVARDENFKLGIIYQGLDFAREPLPAETVAHDLELFSNRFAHRKPFRFLSKPLVIWSGTWRFSRPEVASVTNGVRDRLLLLASERNAPGYHRIADLVDGDAYYWSSVNPDTYPNYEGKLNEMSTAVHRRQGLWIAPVAPGFDARLIGGTTVVPRNNGATMRREYNAAIGSSPDMVGLISWNEFSENSHIEPSRKYDSRGLDVLADIRGAKAPEVQGYDSSEPGRTSVGRGLGMLGVLLVLVAGGMVAIRRQRLSKRW
jgi:glycosyl hydrolase family 99